VHRVLKRTFGQKGDEMTGRWVELHNKGHCFSDSSPSIARMIKSMVTRWAGHVARMRAKDTCRLLEA
jgi:hypothetical protein